MNAGDLETYERDHIRKVYHSFNEKVQWYKNNPPMFTSVESLNGKIGLMCPHCYNYFTRYVHCFQSLMIENEEPTRSDCPELWVGSNIHYSVPKCKFCGREEVDLIQIDVNIVESISKLNKKGFKTKFCCEGHADEATNGYILFEDTSIMEYLNTLPLTWYFDIDAAKNFGHTCIRSEAIDYIEGIMDLKEWVESLPDIYNCKIMNICARNKNARVYSEKVLQELKDWAGKYNINVSEMFPLELLQSNLNDMKGFEIGESYIEKKSIPINFKAIDNATPEDLEKVFTMMKTRTNAAVYGALCAFGNYDNKQ